MNYKAFVAMLARDVRVARRNIVALLFQTFLQPLYDYCEVVFLNQIEQLFFGFEVVVQARQRKTGDSRQVAH